MKTASTALKNYLASRPAVMIAPDCFTITLSGGGTINVTNADVPVTDENAVTYAANSLRLSGLKYSLKVGLDVDEQTVSAAVNTSSSIEAIDGQPFLEAVLDGALDFAYLTRRRVFLPAWGQPAIGSVILFYGLISTISKIGRTGCEVKVKTDLARLDADFPRNIYQASCLLTLYGPQCGLIKSSYGINGSIGAGSSTSTIQWTSGQAADWFDQGTVTFTSGILAGYSATIRYSATGAFSTVSPLPSLPAVGDTFTAYPGCDRTTGQTRVPGTNDTPAHGCAKFNNLANFRGFPFVPPPSTGI